MQVEAGGHAAHVAELLGVHKRLTLVSVRPALAVRPTRWTYPLSSCGGS